MERISIAKFLELFDPFQCKIWVKLDSPLTAAEILAATPVSPETPHQMDMIWNIENREIHAEHSASMYFLFSMIAAINL